MYLFRFFLIVWYPCLIVKVTIVLVWSLFNQLGLFDQQNRMPLSKLTLGSESILFIPWWVPIMDTDRPNKRWQAVFVLQLEMCHMLGKAQLASSGCRLWFKAIFCCMIIWTPSPQTVRLCCWLGRFPVPLYSTVACLALFRDCNLHDSGENSVVVITPEMQQQPRLKPTAACVGEASSVNTVIPVEE